MVISVVGVSVRTTADFDDGEPVLEAGGVGGEAYCIGFGGDCSMVCIIVVRVRTQTEDGESL